MDEKKIERIVKEEKLNKFLEKHGINVNEDRIYEYKNNKDIEYIKK